LFNIKKYQIAIHFEETNRESVKLKRISKGQSLLEVMLTNNIEIKHDCGGVCACSSCHIYINKGSEHLEEMFLKEKHFVDRAYKPAIHSRLACQCLLVDDSGSVEFTIPNY
jgi:2Fe-2S ferredoxin